MKEKRLKGSTIVPGIGFGKAYIVGRVPRNIQEDTIKIAEINRELEQFDRIREEAKKNYADYQEHFRNTSSQTTGPNLIDVYSLILDDPAFVTNVKSAVTERLLSLETAIRLVTNDFITRFNATSDPYFRERATDVIEISETLLSLLRDEKSVKTPEEPVIIIVPKVLLPSDILRYESSPIKGIIAVNAGPTSHAAILARANGIPLVSGIKNLNKNIQPNDEVLIDGYKKCIYVHPHHSKVVAQKEITEYRKRIDLLSSKWRNNVYSKDGMVINVMANVALPHDVDMASRFGADNIGLVRTEYLYFQYNRMPTFAEQVEYFRDIFNRSSHYSPTIRLLDIGGDKIPPYMKIPREFNPFMGWRGIRILLKKRELFKEHLSAIITAAEERSYSLLVPMVSTVKEWREAKKFIQQTVASYTKPLPKTGALFEVPVTLFEMKHYLDEMDFASIGTNDLIQFLMAADRNNPNISYLHNPVYSTFLTIVKSAIDMAHDRGKKITICGEIAGYPLYTILLLGLGLRNFSLSPGTIPLIKEIISRVAIADLTESIQHLMVDDLHEEPLKYLIHLNKVYLGDIFKDYSAYFEPWGSSSAD